MNEFYLKLMRLKYSGMTYPEIRKTIGNRISEAGLKFLFSHKGPLYIPYARYAAEMEAATIEEAKATLRAQAAGDVKLLDEIITQCMESGNMRVALDAVQLRLGLSGLVVPKNITVKSEVQEAETYEQFVAECDALGIDVNTGLSKKALELEAQGKLSN